MIWLPLLLIAALSALLFAPLADCLRCTDPDFFGPFEYWDIQDLGDTCRDCGGRRRVSVVRRWWKVVAKPKPGRGF